MPPGTNRKRFVLKDRMAAANPVCRGSGKMDSRKKRKNAKDGSPHAKPRTSSVSLDCLLRHFLLPVRSPWSPCPQWFKNLFFSTTEGTKKKMPSGLNRLGLSLWGRQRG